MAPEVLLADTTYDQGADWWSLGCVVYQLMAGFVERCLMANVEVANVNCLLFVIFT